MSTITKKKYTDEATVLHNWSINPICMSRGKIHAPDDGVKFRLVGFTDDNHRICRVIKNESVSCYDIGGDDYYLCDGYRLDGASAYKTRNDVKLKEGEFNIRDDNRIECSLPDGKQWLTSEIHECYSYGPMRKHRRIETHYGSTYCITNSHSTDIKVSDLAKLFEGFKFAS